MSSSSYPSELATLSTTNLLEQAKSGSDEARKTLIARYLPWLQKWARGRLPGSARGILQTDGLVHETMLETIRHLDSLDPEQSDGFRGYLRKATQDRIRDEYRRVKPPIPSRPSGDLPDADPSPLEEAIGKATVHRYDAALGRLAPRDQVAIAARLEDGQSYSKIARELGMTEEEARKIIKRALLCLAREMSRTSDAGA